jgi:hypothetical protein
MAPASGFGGLRLRLEIRDSGENVEARITNAGVSEPRETATNRSGSGGSPRDWVIAKCHNPVGIVYGACRFDAAI